jgi:hypothetical protein
VPRVGALGKRSAPGELHFDAPVENQSYCIIIPIYFCDSDAQGDPLILPSLASAARYPTYLQAYVRGSHSRRMHLVLRKTPLARVSMDSGQGKPSICDQAISVLHCMVLLPAASLHCCTNAHALTERLQVRARGTLLG